MSSHAPAGDHNDAITGRVLVSRYRLNSVIAAGGMATVWEGTDLTLARRVAVKILHPHLATDDAFVQRFRGEAVAAARLAHPSIVSVYDTFEDGDVNAIVMELVSGTTLRADLDEHGPLQLHALLAIGTQVADALGAAHVSGLVHRDVKPANILLSADGRVLVADFGIAKAAQGADLTDAGSMVGTAKYLSPEQVLGDSIDGRSDLYSLGVVLYEALTGTPPFVADNDVGTALARLQRDPVPPRNYRTDIPLGVEAVVMRALQRDPNDRYSDAATMRQALLAAGADPSRAQSVVRAAVAASSGEHLAAGFNHSGPSAPAPTAPKAPTRAIPPPISARPAPVPGPHSPTNPTPPPSYEWVGPPRQSSGYMGPVHEVDELGPHRHATPTSHDTEAYRSPGRGRVGKVMVLLLVAALVIASGVAGLVWLDRNGYLRSAPATALTMRSASDFDPTVGGPGHTGSVGDGRENPKQVGNLIDGDPSTTWSTENYRDGRDPAKGGVGFVVVLDGSHRLDQLDIDTKVGGWDASVYALDNPEGAEALSGWGNPIGSITNAPNQVAKVKLSAVRGQAVLVWFTRLAPNSDPKRPDQFNVQVADVTVKGK